MSIPPSSTRMPPSIRRRPTRTTRRGEASGQTLGTPAAATSRATDSGMIRMPVSMAESSSTTERKRGMMKNTPACSRNWKKNMISPPVSWRVGEHLGSHQRLAAQADEAVLPAKNSQTTKRPTTMSQNVGEIPRNDGPPDFGMTQPHTLERSTPKTAVPSPMTESSVPTRSRWGFDSTGASAIRRDSTRMTPTTSTSPKKTQSPRAVGRRRAADQRPGGHRDRSGGGDQAVRLRPRLGSEVPGDEGHDRRHDQRGADAFEERPADDQHGEVRGEAGGQRADAVDHAADRERPATADDRADLPARDHERGHHQRVEGDGGLDAGDGRAHVVGDGGHRHVHHRAVERHQELRGGERDEHTGRCGLGRALRRSLLAHLVSSWSTRRAGQILPQIAVAIVDRWASTRLPPGWGPHLTCRQKLRRALAGAHEGNTWIFAIRSRTRRSARSCASGSPTSCRPCRPSRRSTTGPAVASTTPTGSGACSRPGYAGISWPTEYGGRGATLVEQLIYLEETTRAGAPYVGVNFVGTLHAGPTIMTEATPEQKAEHLPRILRGDEVWCQGFSEPNAGSDLGLAELPRRP